MKRRATNRRAPIVLDVRRFVQPDDLSCGPTCLAQVYRYYGHDKRAVRTVIDETARNPDGGTLAVYLGVSALRNGFGAASTRTTCGSSIPPGGSSPAAIAQAGEAAPAPGRPARPKLQRSRAAYIEFLGPRRQGALPELTRELMVRILAAAVTPSSRVGATYLYRWRAS